MFPRYIQNTEVIPTILYSTYSFYLCSTINNSSPCNKAAKFVPKNYWNTRKSITTKDFCIRENEACSRYHS